MNIQYKVASPYSFEETVTKFKAALAQEKFGILWELNFKDKLQEKGLSFNIDFKVMEACNPAKAQEVLTSNLEAGYFLPCKVVVYDLNGQIYMGMLSPTELIKTINDDSLMEIAQSVEDSLKKAMNNLD